MKNISIILCLITLICVGGCVTIPISESNAQNTIDVATVSNTAKNDLWDEIINSKTTKEIFADQYYFCLLNETLSGSWTQKDITLFLEKCIQEDIDRNGSQSKLSFVRNCKIRFLYAVNTSTGIDCVHYLLEKEGDQRKFPDFKFMYIVVFVFCDADDYDNLDMYRFETSEIRDVEFNDTNDLINFINDESLSSVLFERGWIEIK